MRPVHLSVFRPALPHAVLLAVSCFTIGASSTSAAPPAAVSSGAPASPASAGQAPAANHDPAVSRAVPASQPVPAPRSSSAAQPDPAAQPAPACQSVPAVQPAHAVRPAVSSQPARGSRPPRAPFAWPPPPPFATPAAGEIGGKRTPLGPASPAGGMITTPFVFTSCVQRCYNGWNACLRTYTYEYCAATFYCDCFCGDLCNP
jgi:hypothetical protein